MLRLSVIDIHYSQYAVPWTFGSRGTDTLEFGMGGFGVNCVGCEGGWIVVRAKVDALWGQVSMPFEGVRSLMFLHSAIRLELASAT